MATKSWTDVMLVAAAVAALTLLGCAVEGEAAVEPGGEGEPAAPMSQVQQAALTCGACGSTLTSFNNVPARSNGSLNGDGNACDAGGTAGTCDTYDCGVRWQCVEYVRRYFWTLYDSNTGTPPPTDHAGPGLCTAFRNDSRYTVDDAAPYAPVPGDAFVTNGHTGIIKSVNSDGTWNIIEQNSGIDCNGVATISPSVAICVVHHKSNVPSASRKRTDVAMFYQSSGSNLHVWRTLGSQFAHAGTPYSGAAAYLDDVGDRMVAGDFNGDGKDDIATFAQGSSLNATDGKMRINVWLATGSSSFAAPGVWYTSSGPLTLSLIGGRVVAGDFNGDGKDDLAAFYRNGSSGAILYRWQSTGSGFSAPAGVWNVASGYNLDNVGSRMVAGDFNTDGRDDIANVYRVSSTEYRIHVWRSTGTSFYPAGSQASVAWIAVTNTIDVNTVAGRVAAGDFNTGGKADIAMMQTYGTDGARIIACQSGGTSFLACSYKWARDYSYDLANVGDRFVAGDFNKDGVFDVATAYQVEPGVIKLNVWPGGATQSLMEPEYWWDSTMPPYYSYTLSNVGGRFVTGNWSGD